MKNHDQSSGVPKSLVTITPAKIRNTGKGVLFTVGTLLMLIKGVSAYTSRYDSIPHQVTTKAAGRIIKVEPTLEQGPNGSKISTYTRIYVNTNSGNTIYYAGTYDSAQGWYERCSVGQEIELEGLAEQGTGVFPMEGVHNLADVCR